MTTKCKGCKDDLPTGAFEKYDDGHLHANCRACEQATGNRKKAATRRCSDCKGDLPMDAFLKFANGRLKPKCMNCEKKKLPKGMRVCVDCEATLPQKAFLKYANGYHKKCKKCMKKK